MEHRGSKLGTDLFQFGYLQLELGCAVLSVLKGGLETFRAIVTFDLLFQLSDPTLGFFHFRPVIIQRRC